MEIKKTNKQTIISFMQTFSDDTNFYSLVSLLIGLILFLDEPTVSHQLIY